MKVLHTQKIEHIKQKHTIFFPKILKLFFLNIKNHSLSINEWLFTSKLGSLKKAKNSHTLRSFCQMIIFFKFFLKIS